MKSGNSRRVGRRVPARGSIGRRARAVGVTVGVLAAAGIGLAPNAAAFDVQAQQWYLGPMQTEKMWKTSTGEGIKVAVIGTGVHETPSLRGQVLQGVDALVKDDLVKGSVTDTDDTTGQGTTAAELIAGTGKGGGLKGLAPGVKIIPIRVPAVKHDEAPDPAYPLATAVKAAVDSGAKIIDFTIGNQYVIGSQFGGDAAFEYAVEKGVLMIAGTGDNAKEGNKPQYPAAYPHVVGVAAFDIDGAVSPTSQYGNYTDLAAPGVRVPRWCDATFKKYCLTGGDTVVASALASASAALVWAAHPDWTANQVLRSLIDTAGRDWAKDDPSAYQGYGSVRPRIVLADPHYDAGPADVNPLAEEDGETTPPSPPASASPTTKTSDRRTETTSAVAKSAGDDSNTLAIGVGAAAAVVVIGGAGYAVMRARRAK
ncbi:S8 family serine peptidase [Streptomyces thermodiastaticus]|uniref:S8 family serine peptidase n=1 Tax=Streptomyces thermodiastaticus TaxID=44061 RepID=UPI001675F28C|nr:S8 family serine peptidase [Streptomyces thermodiastaticus]MCE7553201.1 S8 family serine peptidase [Streptomyces thermodiastaticus]